MTAGTAGTGEVTADFAWWRTDQARLERDRNEVTEAFPQLRWIDEDAGGFVGSLPVWPFSRPQPAEVDAVTGGAGLVMELRYRQAYPMVPPAIRPLSPLPSIGEWTVHDWHVNGDGTLCLLQTDTLWDPSASVVDLLLKAAGWRIEYALMKAGVIAAMSVSGIVSDDSFDGLIAGVGVKNGPPA